MASHPEPAPRRAQHDQAPGPAAPSATETVIDSLGRQRRRLTRWTRAAMTVEAVALMLLGAVGLWNVLQTDASTVVAAGFRFGIVAAIAFLVTAVVIAVGWPWPDAVLRRVALTIAIVYAAFFVAGGSFYPSVGGIWETNAATAALFAGVALAGFAEFVLLNSGQFDPDPGSVP